MTTDTQRRLQRRRDRLVVLLIRVSGAENYEEAIARLRSLFSDKETSPAAWLHKRAREEYPLQEADSVQPEFLYEILGQIDTREKFDTVFANLPEQSATLIEKFLDFMVKEYFPRQRLAALELAHRLPPRPGTGRNPKIPKSPEQCLEICDEVRQLEDKGIPKGVAQEQVGKKKKWDMSRRTVQRICAMWEPVQKQNDKIEHK